MNHAVLLALCMGTVLLAASGCTRHISREVSNDGKVAEPVFANLRFLRADGGSYPDPAALLRLGPGMSKGQVAELIGTPHFREGFAAREWDYLFLFRTAQGDRSCRYKVVFDAAYRTGTLLWRPEHCLQWVAMPADRGGVPSHAQNQPTKSERQR